VLTFLYGNSYYGIAFVGWVLTWIPRSKAFEYIHPLYHLAEDSMYTIEAMLGRIRYKKLATIGIGATVSH